MMKAVGGVWVRLFIGFAATVTSVVACGGGGRSDSSAPAAASSVVSPPPPAGSAPVAPAEPSPSTGPGESGNASPTISGTPQKAAIAGKEYAFQPQASDPDDDRVTFTIANKPAWAKFDSGTGRLWGRPKPADVGTYAGIEVAVTDGESVVPLPAFTLEVAPEGTVHTGSVTLAWQAPTHNSDGTPLVDLTGFKIHYGTATGEYTDVVEVPNPGITRYVVENLAPGKYYFAISAYSKSGKESALSPEVSKTVTSG